MLQPLSYSWRSLRTELTPIKCRLNGKSCTLLQFSEVFVCMCCDYFRHVPPISMLKILKLCSYLVSHAYRPRENKAFIEIHAYRVNEPRRKWTVVNAMNSLKSSEHDATVKQTGLNKRVDVVHIAITHWYVNRIAENGRNKKKHGKLGKL